MNLHTTTRVPVNDEYAFYLGKAVYVFAYYEWIIIYTIDYLENGYVNTYSRGKPQTSGAVHNHFKKVIDNYKDSIPNLDKKDLMKCCDGFSALIDKRNALIHAHPITDKDGSQILSYQANSNKPISDMKWLLSEVQELIQEIDKAAIEAAQVLDLIRRFKKLSQE